VSTVQIAIIAVPTGIVSVELARATRQQNGSRHTCSRARLRVMTLSRALLQVWRGEFVK
jgi:hypothetical protein